jgi:hypothetical protein
MARPRGDPARIRVAQRAGTVARLRDSRHLTAEEAEALVVRWEAEAVRQGLDPDAPLYWYEADRWFVEQP